MTRPIQLQMSTEFNKAQATLAMEIEKAKRSPVLAEAKIEWSSLKWDLSDITERSSAATGKVIVAMRSLNLREPYPPGWADLLRTLIVWLLEEKRDVGKIWNAGSLSSVIKASRRLIDYLIQSETALDIAGVPPSIVEDFASSCRSDKDNSTFPSLTRIIPYFVDRGVAPQLAGLEFKPALKERALQSHVQPSTWSEIIALGSAYQALRSQDSPASKRQDFDLLRYYTMLATLLVCAPSRMSELWRTAADIVVLTNPLEHLETIPEEDVENLDFKFALVWHPVKRGRPVIKPIPAAMHNVARDCVDIVRSYGEEARSTARWIMKNPGILPITEELADLEVCRQTGKITSEQLKRLFGLPEDRQIGSHKVWCRNFHRTRASHKKKGGGIGRSDEYCFKTLEAEWWELFLKKWKNSLGAVWPYAVNTETYKLEADRALLLVYDGQLDTRTKYQSKIFLEAPSFKSLDKLLSEQSSSRNLSVFQRLDIRLPDGSHPSIQTHQLRHFLNTMAQRAGLPEPVIAAWSGRRNIAQNVVYDHRTDAERLRAHGYAVADYDEAQVDDLLARQVGLAFEGAIAPPSIEVLSATEASVRELNRQLMISITQFGFCVGDLKSDPCPHAMNCLSCARLVVCKGAAKAKALIEDKIRRLKGQRDLLRAHLAEGGKRLKNEKILPHLDAQIAGAEDMLLALNDPGIEDGTIIARRDSRGAISASFADRVALFAAEQGELQASRAAVENG